jgi:hypothetical protein
MEWLKSKTTIVAIVGLGIVALQTYAMTSMRNDMDERLISIEGDYAVADEKITMLTSDLDVVTKRIGVTTQELEQAQALAVQLKQENAQLARRLRSGLAAKADSKAVVSFQKEASSKLDAVHQETTTKIDGINGEMRASRPYGPRPDSLRSQPDALGSQRHT